MQDAPGKLFNPKDNGAFGKHTLQNNIITPSRYVGIDPPINPHTNSAFGEHALQNNIITPSRHVGIDPPINPRDYWRVRGTRPTRNRKNMLPKRKQIHIAGYDYSNTDDVYFVTICTWNKKAYFKNAKFAQYIGKEIDYRSRVAQEVTVFAYCVMPDHLHLLLKLNECYGKSLANWIAAFKRYNARVLSMMHGIKPLWQANYYEHIVRKDESLRTIAEYIAGNPVRKMIVNEWTDYPYSKINYDAF